MWNLFAEDCADQLLDKIRVLRGSQPTAAPSQRLLFLSPMCSYKPLMQRRWLVNVTQRLTHNRGSSAAHRSLSRNVGLLQGAISQSNVEITNHSGIYARVQWPVRYLILIRRHRGSHHAHRPPQDSKLNAAHPSLLSR